MTDDTANQTGPVRQNDPKSTSTEQKGFLGQVGVWGGLVALVISIANGAFTVHDELVVKPQANIEAKVQQFETAVSSMQALLTDLPLKLAALRDPMERQEASRLANGQIMVLVRNAERLEADTRGRVTAPEYDVLGDAERLSQNLQAAIHYYQLASEQKKTDPATHAESLRLLAGALAMSRTPQGLAKARLAFRDAQRTMALVTSFGAGIEQAAISKDQIITEAVFGSCSEIPSLETQFAQEIDGAGTAPEFAREVKEGLALQLSSQRRCAWDRKALVGAE